MFISDILMEDQLVPLPFFTSVVWAKGHVKMPCMPCKIGLFGAETLKIIISKIISFQATNKP